MTLERYQRAFRSIGGYSGGTSRTARAPQRLLERDIRPIPGLPDCVPPPPLTIHDTFDRPDYIFEDIELVASTSGHTWTNYRGHYRIDQRTNPNGDLNSVAYARQVVGPPAATTGAAFAGFDYGTTDVHLAARATGGTTPYGLFLCFNGLAQGSSSQYTVDLAGSTIVLRKVVGATTTTLATVSTTVNNGGVVEVVKSGGDIDVYLDGDLEISVTDGSPLTGTRHGIVGRFVQSSPFPCSFYDWGYPYNPCDPTAFPPYV